MKHVTYSIQSEKLPGFQPHDMKLLVCGGFLLFAVRKKGRKKTALGLFIMLLHVCVSLYVTYVAVTSICRHCELVRCQIYNVGEAGYFLSENNGIVSVEKLLLG